MKRTIRAVSLAAVAAALAAPAGAATVPGWYSSTDLSFGLQRGNSKTLNAGLNTNLTRQWLRTAWKTNGSFVRNDVSEPSRIATGSATNFTTDFGPTVTKSEKVFVNSDLERRITERFFYNVAGNFERDQFAGLDRRVIGAVGVGYLWQKPDNSGVFRAGVAGTYTSQKETIDDPETEDEFAGVRVTLDGEKRFGDRKQNTFTSNLIVDENVQDTDDLRFNWQNALSVAMNQRLALKVGVQAAYDNQPQLVDFDLLVPPGFPAIKVAAPAEKLDVGVTVSLVINIQPGQGR
jgi:putative salt-induced outer membrane protein YdiY